MTQYCGDTVALMGELSLPPCTWSCLPLKQVCDYEEIIRGQTEEESKPVYVLLNRENDGALVLFKNRKGPSIEPCGTPLRSGLRSAVMFIFRFSSENKLHRG